MYDISLNCANIDDIIKYEERILAEAKNYIFSYGLDLRDNCKIVVELQRIKDSHNLKSKNNMVGYESYLCTSIIQNGKIIEYDEGILNDCVAVVFCVKKFFKQYIRIMEEHEILQDINELLQYYEKALRNK